MKAKKNVIGKRKFFGIFLITALSITMLSSCGKDNTVSDGNYAGVNGFYNGMGATDAVQQILNTPEMQCNNNYGFGSYGSQYNYGNPMYQQQQAYAAGPGGRVVIVYQGQLQRGYGGVMNGTLSGNVGMGSMYGGMGTAYVGKNIMSKDLVVYTEVGQNQVELVLYMCPDIMNYGLNLQQIDVHNLYPQRSGSCYVNEIRTAEIFMQGQMGRLPMSFYPIDQDSNAYNQGLCNSYQSYGF